MPYGLRLIRQVARHPTELKQRALAIWQPTRVVLGWAIITAIRVGQGGNVFGAIPLYENDMNIGKGSANTRILANSILGAKRDVKISSCTSRIM